MKNIFYASPLIFVLVLTGCGTTKQASRTPSQITTSTDNLPKVILYPKGYEGEMERPAIPDRYEDTAADILADVTFSGLESQHVRVKGVNPLPASGRLEVNLDALRDRHVYPYCGKFLSDYGMRNGRPHTGIDIKTVPNDTIRAILPGVVRMSKDYSGYGNIVVIRHPQGFETVYAHCSKNLVAVNDRVEAGTPIGLAGRTGRATTEHLHFEVRVAGEPVDPKKLLDVQNEKLRSGYFYAERHDGALVAYNDPSELTKIKRDMVSSAIEPAPPKTVTAPGLQVNQTTNGTTSAPSSNTKSTTHTVVKGDTLYGIARKHSTTVKELCRLNNIKETDILSLGQKIRVK